MKEIKLHHKIFNSKYQKLKIKSDKEIKKQKKSKIDGNHNSNLLIDSILN